MFVSLGHGRVDEAGPGCSLPPASILYNCSICWRRLHSPRRSMSCSHQSAGERALGKGSKAVLRKVADAGTKKVSVVHDMTSAACAQARGPYALPGGSSWPAGGVGLSCAALPFFPLQPSGNVAKSHSEVRFLQRQFI